AKYGRAAFRPHDHLSRSIFCICSRRRDNDRHGKEDQAEDSSHLAVSFSTLASATQRRFSCAGSVPHVRQHALDLRFLVGGQWKEWQPRWTAEVPVEVHAVLESGNTEIANPLSGRCNSFLLEPGEFSIPFLPGGIDLEACRRGRAGEGEDGSDCPGIERRVQLMRSPDQHLKSNFFLARLHLADNCDCR